MPKHVIQMTGREFLDHGERNDDIRPECIYCGKIDPPKDEECMGYGFGDFPDCHGFKDYDLEKRLRESRNAEEEE